MNLWTKNFIISVLMVLLVLVVAKADAITLKSKISRQHASKFVPLSGLPTTIFPEVPAAADTIYDYTDYVPISATEVLVYVTVTQGSVDGFSSIVNVVYPIYTQDADGNQYAQYVYRGVANNGGWNFNSFTFWLPATIDTSERKRIYIHYPLGSSLNGEAGHPVKYGETTLRIIGYR